GGGVRFTRLLHASTHEALEILLAWHRLGLPWMHHGPLPSSAPMMNAKDRRYGSGSVPPFASHSIPAGAESREVGRGRAPLSRWPVPDGTSSGDQRGRVRPSFHRRYSPGMHT